MENLPNQMAMGIAARLWCESATQHVNMIPELATEFARKIEAYYDLIDAAWGIIANAGNGDWSKETPDWQDAAERWREQYHTMLDVDLVREPQIS